VHCLTKHVLIPCLHAAVRMSADRREEIAPARPPTLSVRLDKAIDLGKAFLPVEHAQHPAPVPCSALIITADGACRQSLSGRFESSGLAGIAPTTSDSGNPTTKSDFAVRLAAR
jgi:hypothetical protein